MKNLLVRLGPKAPRYYVQIMAFILIVTYMITPALAVEDMWTAANRIIVDVYNKIAGISTVLAGLMSAVAVIGAKVSNNQHKTDQAWDWLKRIWIAWAIINGMGAFLAYPKTEWEELIGCTDIQICLGCNDVDTATYISKKCGMVTIKVENNQMPLLPLFSPVYSSTRPYSQTKSNTQRALMLPDEIMRMDNQESLVLLRGQKPLKLYKITPDEHPSFQRLHDVKVSDYTPEWRRQEELAKAERKARAKSRPAPSAPEAGPPPAQPANTAPATPGQKEAGGETAPHKERDQILRQEYDYGLLDPELDRVSSQSPDTEAPYGAFDLIETSPDEVGGP